MDLAFANMTSGRVVTVKQLPERLSTKQAYLFFREVESCFTLDRPRIVFDCSKVVELDSVWIRLLLDCLEEAMMRNGDVKLASIPPEAADVLRITNVNHLFEAFENTADAVKSFGPFSVNPVQQPPVPEDLASVVQRAA